MVYDIQRRFMMVFGILLACLAPAALAEEKTPSNPSSASGDNTAFYQFVNATHKFTDEQISWSFGERGPYTTFAQAKNAPAKMGGGGRMYFKIEVPATGAGKPEVYKDFIEFTQNKGGWYGNTTQVDEFVIPLTIELFEAGGKSQKCGITESRSALFEAFKKEAPKEFQACVVGTQRIVSPCRAEFQKGKAYANYFDKYIDEVWAMYATEKGTLGGWTGKVSDGSLIFSKPGQKNYVLHKKPTTQDAFLGQNELGKSADLCAAINRHVLANPGDWKNVSAYYKVEPYNFYAKFFHEHSIRHLAYGFCYDDFNQQAAYFEGHHSTKLVVTIYWDTPPAP
jgi:hypothetical protein